VDNPELKEPGQATLREILGRHLEDAGFFTITGLSRKGLAETMDACGVSEIIRQKYALDEAVSAVVVSLRYSEGGFGMPSWAGAEDGGPLLGIGRFARANWYAELKERLLKAVEATIAEAAGEGLALPSARHWHRLVNSGLPEKALAVNSGAGRIGKNRILIARATSPGSAVSFSSAVVLGLLICPVDIGIEEGASLPDLCGNCSKCVDACPTGALGSPDRPGFSRLSCIQHWTTEAGKLPDHVGKVFGCRLYGCDACLEACPHFRLDPYAATTLGRIGPVLPARYILEAGDAGMKRDFGGTVLDRAWMSKDAFRRNARLALGAANEH
jgi:epoxyqueuosine reductase